MCGIYWTPILILYGYRIDVLPCNCWKIILELGNVIILKICSIFGIRYEGGIAYGYSIG